MLLDLEATLWTRDLSREGLVRMEEDYARAEKGSDVGEKVVDEETNVEVPEEVLSILEKLVGDRKNEVWLMSGLRMRGVLERIAERVPGLGIVYVTSFFGGHPFLTMFL